MLLSHTTLHRKSTLYGVFRPGSTEDILSTGHSLHCNHPTLRSRVELFNENQHAISIHGPREKSKISLYLILFSAYSRAGEVESLLPSNTLRSLLISKLDWSNLQTFRRWKPYLYPVFYRSIPESSAPRLKQKKVRLGFIKS